MNRNYKQANDDVQYIRRFNGYPYYWNGQTPLQGFDCSFLIVEMLRRKGDMKDNENLTTNGLWKRYSASKVEKADVGVLVFFGTSQKATHIGICINNKTMIEAGGGNNKLEMPLIRNHPDLIKKYGTNLTYIILYLRTKIKIIKSKAYVRERPIDRRSDLLGFEDPYLE